MSSTIAPFPSQDLGQIEGVLQSFLASARAQLATDAQAEALARELEAYLPKLRRDAQQFLEMAQKLEDTTRYLHEEVLQSLLLVKAEEASAKAVVQQVEETIQHLAQSFQLLIPRLQKLARMLSTAAEQLQAEIRAFFALRDSRLRLAYWLAYTLSQVDSEAWEDYQHWFRDILDDHPYLVIKGYSDWEVACITCWRLLMLVLAVLSHQIQKAIS